MNPKSNPPSLFPVVSSNHDFHPDFDFDFDFLHVDPLDADAPFSQWEVVNPSDADNRDSDDPFDFDYVCYDDHDFTADSVMVVKFPPLVEDCSVGNPPALIDQFISSDANLETNSEAKITDSTFADGDGYEYRNEHYYDHEYADDDEESDDGLGDELVPRHLRRKLGRERIRKLGKRGCSKMNTSKKSPFLFVKRGCLHGKHGFGIGLKNSL